VIIALVSFVLIEAAAIVVLIGAVRIARDSEAAAQLDYDRLRKWVLGSLHCLRAECAGVSPQAISVINSLETALPTHAVVDFIGLRRELGRLRELDTAQAIEAARLWDKKLAALEAERAQGEPLPLTGGGS
jgi:hypothetical protein